jgi:hypothetical protein
MISIKQSFQRRLFRQNAEKAEVHSEIKKPETLSIKVSGLCGA